MEIPFIQCSMNVKFTREMVDELDVMMHRFPKSKFPTMTLQDALVRQLRDELQEGYDKVGISGLFNIDPSSLKFTCKTEAELAELEKEWAEREDPPAKEPLRYGCVTKVLNDPHTSDSGWVVTNATGTFTWLNDKWVPTLGAWGIDEDEVIEDFNKTCHTPPPE